MGWCLRREEGGRSVCGDLRDLRLSRLVGRLDEHGLGQLLAGRHRHLLDLIELLQHRESAGVSRQPSMDFFVHLASAFTMYKIPGFAEAQASLKSRTCFAFLV